MKPNSKLKTQIGDSPAFRQALAEKIGNLKTRETISLQIQALINLDADRRAAYAWLKQHNCYVQYSEKRQVIEVQKM
jgi:hypothetical protein